MHADESPRTLPRRIRNCGERTFNWIHGRECLETWHEGYERASADLTSDPQEAATACYSHSIVAGGFPEMS